MFRLNLFGNNSSTNYNLSISLINKCINKFPYSLAFPLYQTFEAIQKEHFAKALNHLLDFYEIAIQYSSCILIKILDLNTSTHNKKVLKQIASKIDTKRPLSMGDWVNDIFIPLLKTAKKELSIYPIIQSLCEYLLAKTNNCLLGDKTIPSIVQLRNEYRGHGTTLSENIYQKVIAHLEPRLLLMLKALEPFADCNAYAIDNKKQKWTMSGIHPFRHPIDESDSLLSNHYYIEINSINNRELFDLYPLIFFDEQQFVYIFQSIKNESLSFISSNENATTITTEIYNDDFNRTFRKILATFDISKQLNWEEYRQYMYLESQSFLRQIYREKKYNQELFVERESLSQLYSEFCNSNATLFPLIGDAGQGKTTQLCYWTEQLITNNKPILIFNSSDFANYTLEEYLKRIFNISYKKDITRLLNSLHQKARENGSYIYFFFDAINECTRYKSDDETQQDGPYLLFRTISELLVSPNYSCFKILFTCRLHTWKSLILPNIDISNHLIFRSKHESNVNIKGFNKEETRKAYHIYQSLYQMKNSFDDLNIKIKHRLRDPLILKFTCSNYLGQKLTQNSYDYTSLSLFEKKLNDINNSYAGNMQCKIIDGLAEYMLSQFLSGLIVNYISTKTLKEAYNNPNNALHRLSHLIYKKDGITIAYAELLNNAEHPILKEVQKTIDDIEDIQIQFIYERFLEYVIGRAFVKYIRRKFNFNTSIIPARVYVDVLKISAINVIFVGSIRNALLIDYKEFKDLSTLIELASLYGDQYNVMTLITDVIDTLIKENYENDIFLLMNQLLNTHPHGGIDIIKEYNDIITSIAKNQANDLTITNHNRLKSILAPTLRLRKLATVSILNGIMLSDFYIENLYDFNVKELLWQLMTDDILDVRNDACMYIYYLSNHKYTLDNNNLSNNLTEQIVKEIYEEIKSHKLLYTLSRKHIRKQSFILVETATRLCTLLIIDNLISKKGNPNIVINMLSEIRSIVSYFSCNFVLIKLALPFFQVAMRRQITFQSDYVNNAIEYETFWEQSTFTINSKTEWTKKDLKEAMSFLHHNIKFSISSKSDECIQEELRFKQFSPKILSAYLTGDSFSYFALERILVIMGVNNWDNVKHIILDFFSDKYRQTHWFDYSQMSMLYIMYQIQLHSTRFNPQILQIFSIECEDWTCRNKGIYKARRCKIANANGVYKRNIMSWYSAVYCSHSGDGTIRENDTQCVPLFYKLISLSIKNNDKELLFHLIENISELISDLGYINTALQLLKHIMLQYNTIDKISQLDNVRTSRGGIYQYSLIKLIGNVLSTAKNYFPKEVDLFIQKEIICINFPGASTYREDILNFQPSGETLSDLFTHKFGKFLMWALLNKEVVDNFALEAMNASVEAKSCTLWYKNVIRILFKHMFNVNI